MADRSDVQQFCYDAPDRGFCSSMATDEKMLKVQRFFFLRVEFCEEIIHPPRFVVVFCTKAPGPGGYSVCVCMREIICGTAFQTWFTDFTPTFLFLKLSPLVLSKVSRSGILEEKKTTPLGHFPKTRPLLPPTSLRDVSSFTLSLRSYRTPKLPLYIREFCLRKNSIACETRHYYCIEIDSK